MGGESHRESPDQVLARLASPRKGAVGHRRAVAAGVGRGALQRRLDRGALHLVHDGVYAVGHPGRSDDGWLHAALEACGDDAAIGHLSAARRYRLLRDVPARPVHVTLPREATYVRRDGIVAHRPMDLDPLDVTVHDGLRITTVPRTLLEIALAIDRPRLARAVHHARVEHRMPVSALRDAMQRAPRARGLRRLHEVAFGDAAFPPNKRERRFLRLVRDAGLPLPQTNVLIETGDGRFLVDCLWPAQMLIYEIDDLRSHATTLRMLGDRRQDTVLQDLGYRVRRVTDEDLWPRASRTAARLARQLRCD